MRCVGLVILGLVLWAGQASAEKIEVKQAVKIVVDGEIIHKHTKDGFRFRMRVIHKGDYYVCKDFQLEDRARLTCYSMDY